MTPVFSSKAPSLADEIGTTSTPPAAKTRVRARPMKPPDPMTATFMCASGVDAPHRDAVGVGMTVNDAKTGLLEPAFHFRQGVATAQLRVIPVVIDRGVLVEAQRGVPETLEEEVIDE